MGIPLLPPKDPIEREAYYSRLRQLRSVTRCDPAGQPQGHINNQEVVRSWIARNGWTQTGTVDDIPIIRVVGPGIDEHGNIAEVTHFYLADLA